MARVTVVVASANARNALMATVETILAQSYRDYELFITDDGSTDGTGPEVLSRLGPDPSRVERVWWDSLREDTGTRSVRMVHDGILVHYLHQVTARGTGAARNRALALATGDLLSFADPGDLWQTDKLEDQMQVLDEHQELGAILVAHDDKRRRAAAKRKSRLTPVSMESILECTEERLSGSIVRKACLGNETPFDENLPVCEDFDFWLRLTSRYPAARLEPSRQVDATAPQAREWGLERFRVYALEKAYQSGHLSPLLRHRVAEELVHQCDLLVEGYRHGENHERANFYDRKKKRFAQEVAKLDLSDPIFSRSHAG